tara:strand:+ start:332 stop:529 length:198 start_codon:yes stop_codon:yes gene_type:complete
MNIKTDPLVEKVAKRMLQRSNAGIIKYGNTMRTAEKPLVEWINDAQEELLDAVVYLEKIKEKVSQ